MKVPKCKECKHSIWNTGGEFCSKNCPEGELFEPIEKTYNLLELVESEEYSCDEHNHEIFRLRGVKLEKENPNGSEWYLQSNPLFYKKCTFRKIKKKLQLADLVCGDTVADKNGTEWEVLAFRDNVIVVWRLKGGGVYPIQLLDLENWKKKGAE